MDKKEKNNLILLKYSKDYKSINNKEQIKVKKNETNNITRKDNDIKKEQKLISKEENEDDKNIEIGNIKDIQKEGENIPFNQEIFKKILEEVKGEKNYFQKIVHRQLMNKRNFLRNSFSYSDNSFNKYDDNTFKEITIKRIKNPFNISINKENINSINQGNENGINGSNENKNANYSSINLSLVNAYKNNENINKKSTIKIKKIPLNKLKNRIKIPHMNLFRK